MNDEQLLRYSRHLLLPQLDVAGQEAICAASVLIVGLGGLGSPVALYLAASGVGELLVCDDDQVEVPNLQRQIIHAQTRLGANKAQSAAAALAALNPEINITSLPRRLDDAELRALLPRVTVVADCSDNLATRLQLNALCREFKVPLVSAAAIRFEGQLTVFDFRRDDSPCYRCLHPHLQPQDLSCSQNGIFSPVVGVVGSMQALEVLKLVAGIGQPLVGRLAVFDGLSARWQMLKFKKNPSCEHCAN